MTFIFQYPKWNVYSRIFVCFPEVAKKFQKMPKSEFWQRNSPHFSSLTKNNPKLLQIGGKVAKICSIFWQKNRHFWSLWKLHFMTRSVNLGFGFFFLKSFAHMFANDMGHCLINPWPIPPLFFNVDRLWRDWKKSSAIIEGFGSHSIWSRI